MLPIHEARHNFASICIAAGINAKALSSYMGHGSIGITFEPYGHRMPGNEVEATGLLDAYLLQSESEPYRSRGSAAADLSGPERNGEDPAIPVPMREAA